MNIQDLESKFTKSVVMIETKGKEYADARALYNYLYEMRKTVLAAHIKASCEKTHGAKEADAYSSTDYITHLEGIKEAEGSYLRLEAEYERWKAETEALRTLISLEKEKIRNFGG